MRRTSWTAADTAVEYLDAWADWLPSFEPDRNGCWRWYRHGGWGCSVQIWFRLSTWLESTGIDHRW